MNQLTQQIPRPDEPFRIGASGKYKLLIKSVTPCFNGYKYSLVDADGKEYVAESLKHYAPNQLLRCIVNLKVVNAAFEVSETRICGKQDFAMPIPDSPKPRKPLIENKKGKAAVKNAHINTEPNRKSLGDPMLKGASGNYVFRVVAVEQKGEVYSYKVEDAKGRQYEVGSKQFYSVGAIVDCKVSLTNAPSGALKIFISAIKAHSFKEKQSGQKHRIKGSGKSWHSGYSGHDWPLPSSGDHFHLIYTPMGNKR